MPTPPVTINAPVVVEVLVAVLLITELLAYNAPPMPTPPLTTKAPVVVLVEVRVLPI